MSSLETEMTAIEIDTRTEEPDSRLELKRNLIMLLLDPEVRAQLYEAIQTEDALQENRARLYR